MPQPRSRAWSPVRLRVLSPKRAPGDRDAVPFLPWPLACALAGIGAAIISWLVVAGVMLACWFSVLAMSLPDTLAFGTRLWLLALGAPASVGDLPLTVMPLGLTGLVVWLVAALGRAAARQAALARPGVTSTMGQLGLAGRAAGLTLAGFVAAVALAAFVVGRWSASACVGAAVVGLIGLAWAGARWIVQTRPDALPGWLRSTLAGTAGGLLALAAVGAVVAGVATVLGWSQIEALEDGLGPDSTGLVVLGLLVVAWWPNALAWAASWALGGGFAVGAGSSVSLTGTQLGLLPAIPVLGALPPEGVAPPATGLWMLSGVLAGVVAAWCAGGLRRGVRLVEQALVCGASGLLACALFVLVAAASRGDLGADHLVGLGPLVGPLLMIAPALLVLSATITAVLAWLVHAR